MTDKAYVATTAIPPNTLVFHEILYKLESRYAKDKPIKKEKDKEIPNFVKLINEMSLREAPISPPRNAGNKVKKE